MSVIICLVIIFSLILMKNFFKLRKWNDMRIKVNKFPGRRGYPIIGNLIEMYGDRKRAFRNIQGFAEEFIERGISRAWLFTFPFLIITNPEEVEIILSSTTHIRKGVMYSPLLPWLGTGLLTSSGQKWHRRRKMLTPAFHFTILQKFLKVFSSESRNLVKVLENHANEEFDIVEALSKSMLNVICETSMGIPLVSLDIDSTYYKCIHNMGRICIERLSNGWSLMEILYFFSPNYWHQKKFLNYLHTFSSNVIQLRKNVSEDSTEIEELSYSRRKKAAMLDILLLAQKNDGNIDDEGIREEVDTFMFEGHDTTSLSLIYTLMLLANNRIHQDKIFSEIISVFGHENKEATYSELQELKYMEMCIKESLRLYPSVPYISRNPYGEITSKTGDKIPKNCDCVVAIYNMHRRPDIYPNPEVFDPYRFLPENIGKRHPFAYIPFSAGPRNCIGQKFAMLEMKCVITEILRNFILEPVDTPETIEILLDIVLRPAGPIRVKFIPRHENNFD